MVRAECVTLAACYRARCLALSIVRGRQVLEVRCHRIPGGYRSRRVLQDLVRGLLSDYAIDHIVVEAGQPLTTIASALDERTEPLSLATAKRCILGAGRPKHDTLFLKLLAEHPQLQRLVTVLPGTRRIATSERRKTVQLLSVALALAGEELLRHE